MSDLDALVREAYRLGYRDRSEERDYDPGHALDLLTRVVPSEPSARADDGYFEPSP